MEQCKNYFLTLNIFQASSSSHQEVDEDPYEQRTQVVATRVYFLLLVLILVIFLVITCLNSQTITISIPNPSLTQIESLPANRICPCSRISFSYDKFVTSSASFHQVCSSDFVSDRWIASLFYGMNASHFLPVDFRSVGFAQFQALASFCRLSQANVNQTLLLFGSSLFISAYFDYSPTSLRTKVMTTFNRSKSSTSTTFKSQIQLISTSIASNHFLNALGSSIVPNQNRITISRYKKQVGYYCYRYDGRNPISACFCAQTETLTDESCRGPSGIYEEHFDVDTINTGNSDSGNTRSYWYEPTMVIPNFTSSCMPVDACLLSSLECFFNQSCVNAIYHYQTMVAGVMWNFTALNSDNTLKPSRFNISSRIKSIVDELMVEEWLIQELYDKYFQQCAPVVCTYLENVYPDFLSVLHIFIGLLGGLCRGLRLIVLPVVRYIRRRLRSPPVNPEPSQSPHSLFRLCRRLLSKIKRILLELNLLKTNLNDDNDPFQIRCQRITTRLYIGILAVSAVIITFYLGLSLQTNLGTIKDPIPANFSHFYSLYPSSLQCACSSISTPYNVFLTIEPHYHQMCTSDLVSPTWWLHLRLIYGITQLAPRYTTYNQNGGSQFILLKALCTEAKQTINNSLEQFLNQIFVTTQVISKETFESEMNVSIKEWKEFTIKSFIRTVRLVQATQFGNHLVAKGSNSFFDVNVTSNTFILNSSFYYDQCNCMLSPSCHTQMSAYENDDTLFVNNLDIPGFFMGCFRLEALLNSTLECFYNQTCIDAVIFWVRYGIVRDNITALNASGNLPNETINSVVSRLFVEKWSDKISFENYFTACAPQSCTYENTRRPKLISLVTSVISICGGLSSGLKIVLLVLLWLTMKVMRSNISLRAIKTWLYTRVTEKQHLQRGLHIVLVVTTLIALYFASTFTLKRRIKQNGKLLSIKTYEQLLADYSDTLQCPCARISIPYKDFMNVTVSSRHQVCSSPFITDEWIATLLLPEPQSSHSPFDFKKTAISFFQLLAYLCQLSDQHLTVELSDLMARSLINTHVISRLQLNEQIQSIIDQFKLNTPLSFVTTLQLIRAMISDNTLIPVFETNWQWTAPSLNHPDYWGRTLYTKPIVYNGSCNCGLSSQCFQESSTMPGLMVGCYPLESLLKSTLQCLYNVSCFSLLQNVNGSFAPLNDSSQSKYQKNSTVELILNQLMVEQWNTSVTYENYYKQCAPSLCSYIERRPTLQVLTLLLGLYGGLTIIMDFVALLLAAVWQKILIRLRRRQAQVQPM